MHIKNNLELKSPKMQYINLLQNYGPRNIGLVATWVHRCLHIAYPLSKLSLDLPFNRLFLLIAIILFKFMFVFSEVICLQSFQLFSSMKKIAYHNIFVNYDRNYNFIGQYEAYTPSKTVCIDITKFSSCINT